MAAGAAVGAAAVPACPMAGAAVGAMAALLPDVDHPGSTIGRRLRPLAVVLEELWGHRSLTHTLWFILPAGLLLGGLAGWLFGLPAGCVLAGAAGGLSHLALDALTRSGVEPFGPWGRRFRGPVATGGVLDVLLGVVLAVLAATLVSGSVHGLVAGSTPVRSVVELWMLEGIEVGCSDAPPWWARGICRVAPEPALVDLAEVQAECAWIGRQHPGLRARVWVCPHPAEALEPRQGTGAGRVRRGDPVWGLASGTWPEAVVFVCAPTPEAYVVAHELGHLAWHQLLSSEQQAAYVSLRGLEGEPDWYVAECFAEDFRLTFGSQRGRERKHAHLDGGPPARFADLFGR